MIQYIGKRFAIPFFVCIAVLAAFFVLLLTGTVKVGCEGVAIDAEGRIYVGLTDEIRVFDDRGVLLRTLSPHTGKGYQFAIENDLLLVDAGGRSYSMDLDGGIFSNCPSQHFRMV